MKLVPIGLYINVAASVYKLMRQHCFYGRIAKKVDKKQIVQDKARRSYTIGSAMPLIFWYMSSAYTSVIPLM